MPDYALMNQYLYDRQPHLTLVHPDRYGARTWPVPT